MSPDKEDQKKISQCSSIIPNRVEDYPEGLRILAVDDNPVCLKLLTALLKKCGYQFTVTTDTAEAYNILKKNRNSYDLVLTDVKNNMDGCKFAQSIDLEMDIPVIIMSADDGKESIMNCVKHGARGYLLKPVRYEELKIIWQHVARKNYYRIEKTVPDKTETNSNSVLVRHMDDTNDREGEIKAQLIKENKKLVPKKPRCSWKEIHTKFENVVAQLGVENAVPKKILELMNEPNLTRENVASHLQKFRKNWNRKKEKAKRLTSECEKAIKSIHCSNALPNYSVNQCIVGQHYQNSSMEPIVTDTDLHSFGAKLRAISSNNLIDGMPQNHLRFSSMGGQMNCTIENNPVNDISVTSSHSGQYFGPKHELDGMRFNSYSRPVKTENNHLREYACSSGGYNQCRAPHSQAHPTNSSFMLPPNSTSYGQRYMLDRNHSTQMIQPINSSPMLPSSSSYGQIYMANSTYSTEVAQPNNYQPMPAQSFSFGQLERGNSFGFKGREENKSLSRELSLDSNTLENLILDQILLNSDIGTDLPILDMGDELVDVVSQFEENSAPSL